MEEDRVYVPNQYAALFLIGDRRYWTWSSGMPELCHEAGCVIMQHEQHAGAMKLLQVVFEAVGLGKVYKIRRN